MGVGFRLTGKLTATIGGRFLAEALNGITGQMPRSRAATRLPLLSYPLSPTAARGVMSGTMDYPKVKQNRELRAVAGLTLCRRPDPL